MQREEKEQLLKLASLNFQVLALLLQGKGDP